MEFTSVAVLVLAGAVMGVAAYQYKKKRAKKIEVVAPTPEAPEPPTTFAGEWVFDIVPTDRGKWGDGSHPDEKIHGYAQARSDWADGQQWRLDWDGSFVRDAQGRLSGMAYVCGAKVEIAVDVPINGGAVGFHSDGVYLEFHFDGVKLYGVVFEPHDKENKRGYVVGRKI